MEFALIYAVLVIAGLCMGSFAGATVWRLRARQLADDKKHGQKVDHSERMKLKKLTKSSLLSDRSQCLNCSYALRWYDLIPVVSWLMLRGRCRQCRSSIGIMEPLIEVGVAAFFVLSYAYWPLPLTNGFEVARLIIWLLSGVGLAILFAYDARWYLLPDKANFTVMGLGLLNAVLAIMASKDLPDTLINVVLSVVILGGLYLTIYLVSAGKWVGFGDVKLGLGLGLLLADWRLAFIALFAANLLGCIIVLPGMITGKLKRDSHVPFGPLLIAGFVLAGLAGVYIIGQYYLAFL